MVAGQGEARVEENGLGEGRGNPAEIARMVAGCSLQLGWLPVACFMAHARWIALPLETLLPFLAFLLACAVTLGLSYRLARLVEGHPRWIQTLQCLLLAVGSVLAFLGDGSRGVSAAAVRLGVCPLRCRLLVRHGIVGAQRGGRGAQAHGSFGHGHGHHVCRRVRARARFRGDGRRCGADVLGRVGGAVA